MDRGYQSCSSRTDTDCCLRMVRRGQRLDERFCRYHGCVREKSWRQGLVDIHAWSCGEPGWRRGRNDCIPARQAALSGGFTSIACAPNTNPPIDTQGTVQFVKQQAADANNCHVYPIACVSKNRIGEELAEMGTLVDAGAVAFSDACSPISNPELMRRALRISPHVR